MLSKSAARRFFLLGTVACSAAFVLLTIDTIRQVPKLTNAQNLTPEVVHGKHLWDSKNCMGCHTIMGEGAYYAPELTKVYERRGEAFIKAMLKDPQSMYPGQRKMVNYKLTDQEINDLTAFLKWVGQMDLQGFPPKPQTTLAVAQGAGATGTSQEAISSTVARPAIFGQVCVACHSLGGQGGNVGPALDGVGSRRDADYLTRWLHNPADVKPDSKMPKLPLTEDDVTSLVTFLSSQKGEVAK